MDKHILVSIVLFMLADFTVVFSFFLPEWIISNVGGEIQIGLWQTCINTKRKSRCFVAPVPNEWLCAIFFIILGCFFATLTVVTFVGSLKTRALVSYGRWLGMATLASYCIASILIPMGFSMDAIRGEPFQLPSSFNTGSAYILFNISIWVTYVKLVSGNRFHYFLLLFHLVPFLNYLLAKYAYPTSELRRSEI